ncbi:MAG: endonuclease/exonuclease/phosphatase family protein, partial [Oscillospiraceae bacterium]
MANLFPFVNLADDSEYFEEVGVAHYSLVDKVAAARCKQYSLNDSDLVGDKFIDDNGIDADLHYYNLVTNRYHGYVDSDKLNKYLGKDCSTNLQSMMHLNAGNLVSKVDLLSINLKLLKHKISIIGITETWTNMQNENCINLPGYNKYVKSRVNRKGGGVALYLNSDLNISTKLRPDLVSPDDDAYESLFLQLSQSDLSTKDIIVGVIYRPPGTDVNKFLTSFSALLEKISKENRPCYLMGDYNIDLIRTNTNIHSQSFVNQLLIHGFLPKIENPTRITNSSATLIDNILTNVHNTNITSGIWMADISDHLPIYLTLPYQKITHKSPQIFITKRFYSEENMNKFKTQLNNADWSPVYSATGSNNKYQYFIDMFTDMHNSCFPLRNVKFTSMSHNKPWITPTILNSIKKKNNMYKQYLLTKNMALLEKYKKYKNKLTTIIRTCEQNYFSNKLNQMKGKMSRTWQLLNKMTNRSNADHK